MYWPDFLKPTPLQCPLCGPVASRLSTAQKEPGLHIQTPAGRVRMHHLNKEVFHKEAATVASRQVGRLA